MLALALSLLLPVVGWSESSSQTAAGFVVRVDSAGVYLDLGQSAGAAVGQRFEVYEEGAELRHPVTGQTLGRVMSVVASGQLAQVEPLYSLGRLDRPSSEISAGLRARLVPAAPPTAAARPAPGGDAIPTRVPKWKGPSFDFPINGLVVADFLGNGQKQLALADQAQLYLFPYPPADDRPVAIEKVQGIGIKILSLEAADLDGDGKAELFASVYNETFGRVETIVYRAESGRWSKIAEIPYVVRSVGDEKGARVLAAQQLEDDSTFPFSGIYPLAWKDGKFVTVKRTLPHKRVDWIYDYTTAQLDGHEPAILSLTSTNHLRAQFEKGYSKSREAFGQSPIRIRWPNRQGRLLEFHPPFVVASPAAGQTAVYAVRNLSMLGSLSEPFGLFNGGEVHRLSWNGVSLQSDWKADLGGYSTGLSLVSRAGQPDELAVAVVGTSGKSSVWAFDP